MAITDFTIIRRSLLGRRFLSITTLLTVAVAVALLLVLLSMKDAGLRAFQRGSGNMQLIVSRDGSPLVTVLNGIFFASTPRNAIDWSEYEAIAERFPLEYAVPIQQGDSYRGAPIIATTPEIFTAFSPDPRPVSEGGRGWELQAGSFLREGGDTWEAVLGAKVAAEHGLAVGDHLHLTHGIAHHEGAHHHDEFEYHVAGILAPTGGPQDRAVFTHLESTWILHAHDRRQQADASVETTTAADLTDDDRKITGIYMRVASRRGSMLAGGMQQVFDQLRRDTSITVAQPGEQIRTLFTIVSSIDQIFLGLVLVVLVSSGIAILLALYSSTEQRRRQIAMLRVLGFSRGRVFGLVLTESALLGLVGAVIGVAMGIAGCVLVAGAMQARLGLVLEPQLLSRWTLVVVTGTIVMAACAGIVPAVRAYRIPVVKSLAPLG